MTGMTIRPGTYVTVVRTCSKTGTRVKRLETVTHCNAESIRLTDGSVWPLPVPGADRVFHRDFPNLHLEFGQTVTR